MIIKQADGTYERSAPADQRRLLNYVGAATVYAFFLLVSVAVLYPVLRTSLTWRLRHDSPFMLYMGYLMEHFNYVPYRDFFDVNMLGTYLSYQYLGRYFGFTDHGMHVADLMLLGILAVILALMLWRLGLRVVWAAFLLFSLSYLLEGSSMTLQRDYLVLFPVGLGIALAVGLPGFAPTRRALLAGFCFSAAAAIKPHVAIGLLPVLIYLASEQSSGERGWRSWSLAFLRNGAHAALGGILPVIAVVGYLLHNGALHDFMDSALHYVPLYAELTERHELLSPEARRRYVMANTLAMGGLWPQIVMGFIGLGAGFGNTRLDAGKLRIVSLLAMLIMAYAVYPAITGQFWQYHYLPFVFFLSISASLVFMPHPHGTPWQKRLIPLLMVLLVCCYLFKPQNGFRPLYHYQAAAPPKGGRVEAVTDYLKQNMRPGDTVQPLDWVSGGMLQAMLYAGAKPATEFLCYFHFFHHVDTPYIRALRVRFMESLSNARPRFIIKWVPDAAGWIKPGPRTAMTFPEVDEYIARHYEQKQAGNEYIIYERNAVRESGVSGS